MAAPISALPDHRRETARRSTTDNPDSLVTDGPYFYIRHPFYASYIVFWIGWASRPGRSGRWCLSPASSRSTRSPALDEERKFSRTALADAYEAYRATHRPVLAASGRQPAKAAEAGCAMTDIGRQCRRFL